jgi:hypothetical protein
MLADTGIALEDQELIAADQPRSWAWICTNQGEPRSDLKPLYGVAVS